MLGLEAGAQVTSGVASPAHAMTQSGWRNDAFEPSPLTAVLRAWNACDMGVRNPLPGHVLVTARCPAGHSCSWGQQPSLGSGDVCPHWCKTLFPSPQLCVGLIWISFSIPFVPGKMKLPKSPKFMFSRPFIIYNSILLVFKPNTPNLFMHLLFPLFLLHQEQSWGRECHHICRWHCCPGNSPRAQRLWLTPAMSRDLPEHFTEEQISLEAAVEPHNLHDHHPTPALRPAVPWPIPHFPKASQLQPQQTCSARFSGFFKVKNLFYNYDYKKETTFVLLFRQHEVCHWSATWKVLHAGPGHHNTWYLQVIHTMLCNTYRKFPGNSNQNTGKKIKILQGKKRLQRKQKSSKTCYGQNNRSHNSPLSTTCFSTFFTPNRAGPAAPFPLGTEWPSADGPSSELLTLSWIQNVPKTEGSLSVPDTSVAKEHRLLWSCLCSGRFFPLSSWPENCQPDFPDTPFLTPAWATAILCLRSWISSQNNL